MNLHGEVMEEGATFAPARTAPAEDPAEADSYDLDLDWILHKLVERTGGMAAVILRVLEGELVPTVLANYGMSMVIEPELVEQIHQTVRQLPPHARGREGNVQHAPLEVRLHDVSRDLRLQWLTFTPTRGVVLIAAVVQHEFSLLPRDIVSRHLHPVLSRYIHLWWLHRTERRRGRALRRAMDLSDLGIAMLDRRGDLTFANSCMERLLAERSGVQRVGNGIDSTNTDESLRLQAAIQRAIVCNRIPGMRGASDRAPILALRRAGKRSLIVTVVTVDRVAMDPEDPAAILHVLDPERDVRTLLAPACRIYRLTSAESRLVGELVGGATLAESAASLCIGLQTARTYLKQVFQKTQTKRQSELVRVMVASAARSNVGLDFALM